MPKSTNKKITYCLSVNYDRVNSFSKRYCLRNNLAKSITDGMPKELPGSDWQKRVGRTDLNYRKAPHLKMGKCKYCIINKLHQNLCKKKVGIDMTCKRCHNGIHFMGIMISLQYSCRPLNFIEGVDTHLHPFWESLNKINFLWHQINFKYASVFTFYRHN